MTVARRKGDAGKADRLFSLIVRSRGRCEYPGCTSYGPYETAHIIRRNNSGVRCVEDNAWSLCGSHHRLVDNWADEHQMLVGETIGHDRYRELRGVAEGHKHRAVTSKVFWREEAARMVARCRELGIDTRRAA